MLEPTVIVTFDVTEPHLQYCLDSLARQRNGDRHGVETSTSGTRSKIEVVLVPVRNGTGGDTEDTISHRATDRDGEGDVGTADGENIEVEQEENEQGDESVESGREEGLAVAIAFAAAPPEGLCVTLLDEEAASDHRSARARGVDAATGTHLLFLEGRDALTAYAVAHLLHTAGETGADLVAANVHRFNELGAFPSKAHKKYCAKRRSALDPRTLPALVADPVLGNKLWRREFWQSLPELCLAPEDSDLELRRAVLAARNVDVLPGPVLLARQRESVGVPMDEAVLTRRITTMRELSLDLGAEDRRLWDRILLQGELHRLVLRLRSVDPQIRSAVVDLLNEFLDHVPAAQLRSLSVLDRLLYHLVRKRRIDDLIEVGVFAGSVEIKNTRVVRRGLAYYISYPFFEDTDPAKEVPREIYRLDEELKVRQKTENVCWQDGRLHIGGRIGIRHLRARKRWQQHLIAFAVNTETGWRIRVPVRTRLAAEYRLPDVVDAARHDYGGFTVVLDPRKLRTSNRWQPGAWKIELIVFNRGLTRRQYISSPVPGPPERPPYRQVAEDVWVRPRWSEDKQLVVGIEPMRARVTGHHFTPGTGELLLEGEVLSEPATEATQLRLTRRPGTAVLTHPLNVRDGRFTVKLSAEELFERSITECGGVIRQEDWDVHLLTPDGRTAAPVLPEDVPAKAHASATDHLELAVQRTATGAVKLRAGRARPTVKQARWQGRALILEGEFTADAPLTLVAKARGREEEHVFAVEHTGHHFTARFTPADIDTLSGNLSLPMGSYQLWGRVQREDGESVDVGVEFVDELIGAVPLQMQTADRAYALSYQGRGIPVLRVDSDLYPSERGSFAQRELKEVFYPAERKKDIVEGVLFDTYTGRQYSDSPQSIYAELRRRGRWADYPMSWLVADGQVSLPEGLSHVRHRGREYYEALARSRYLVTNSRQPAWFHRHPDQVVVQTWHGSMLKRIGFDVENISGKSRDYFDKLAWETQQWDYLVSPSPWATPILRSAFRFDGEILETGYPRNDIFFSPDKDAIAERTRRRLGLPEDKKVVLYAPTWRDDKYYTRGKHKLDLHLDLRRMYDKLGDDHVLLVRRHPRVVDSVPIVGEGFVHDVSLYPEVMELFLLTDVLVTDYSSMMFDFANTGRPMLFFTYDLESYRDNLRGFYFDFEETAPGPLLTESDQVIDSLLNIDEVAGRSRAAYDSFVEQFCPLDDGHAAARVVDRVFGGA